MIQDFRFRVGLSLQEQEHPNQLSPG